MRAARTAAAAAALLTLVIPSATAGADSFTPVRLTINVAAIARRHAKLPVTVHVSADPGVLDTRTEPLRIRVKLAPECGGTFQYTTGDVLLDKQLSPQPASGRAYSAVARGSGKPSAYGQQAVCAWLDEEGDNRTFASDQSLAVNVSPACTSKAARYDRLRKALRRAKRRHRGVARARRRAKSARRAALRACGRGVPL